LDDDWKDSRLITGRIAVTVIAARVKSRFQELCSFRRKPLWIESTREASSGLAYVVHTNWNLLRRHSLLNEQYWLTPL